MSEEFIHVSTLGPGHPWTHLSSFGCYVDDLCGKPLTESKASGEHISARHEEIQGGPSGLSPIFPSSEDLCDSCRQRKTRCDARDPCGPCTSMNQTCLYGTDAISRGKSELILDTVLRMEASIAELRSMVAMGSGSNVKDSIQANTTSPVSTITPRSQDARHHASGCTIRDPTESAVLSSGHLSSAESLLKWSVFLDHPLILRETETSFLSLEYGRESFQSKVYGIFPTLGLSQIKKTVGIFQQTYNFWFPTMSFNDLKSLKMRIYQENLEPNCHSCLALLVMALGIFWSCFVLESNYISELPTLPQNCNAEIESIISLPGKFHSHETIEDEEKSTFYFLASIALRRLLNRAHYMLYDRDIGLQIDSNTFSSVNQELARQLQDWYQTLPSSLQFPDDGKPAIDPHSEYLRQWYLSCRSVIYRPFLEWALANPSWNLHRNPRVLDGCRVALDTCLFKLRDLKQVPYTVMVDTWPCSLSLATAMLTLMGGFCHPQLTMQLRHITLLELGPHLEQLLQRWMNIHGSSVSPGIEKALRLTMKAHEFFQSKGADFCPSPEREECPSPYALRMSHG
ncbi:Glycoside hydrolase family 2 immunoglobulin-like beta-sandwich [Penicillium nucicola]|uniref:Glycoside hydrolase family 2 immunoglobulin-like beta-sandwich n=1 Tax=Penicillium nucicola TaxID=1850975 RepID=UPI0025453B19|nr:Glycoside hydrolase family 2 immunoglobulin-like beta-sandwich [Penicillium nucicola]KAJ5776529.1 Glycoside hydrolase family 2 immunoglobulin-like beta-sandwich [Penicillium nucicola]